MKDVRTTCNLTTAVTVRNILSWDVEPAGEADEDGAQWNLRINFYPTLVGSADDVARKARRILHRDLTVTNVMSTRLTRGPGLGLADLVLTDLASSAGAFTACFAAWDPTKTVAVRKVALANALIAAGLMVNLGGTVA